eukprot:TRINITY_DN23040_c0_g1_i1.p1 TRINITY_DN23040_c0_g1~~TRINITY_DN23040_c0_g1_i1.p1  ORF type:complete len:696 (-),score=137.39 TRINITY_DN23040_c0_g1_i1:74-2161(-)
MPLCSDSKPRSASVPTGPDRKSRPQQESSSSAGAEKPVGMGGKGAGGGGGGSAAPKRGGVTAPTASSRIREAESKATGEGPQPARPKRNSSAEPKQPAPSEASIRRIWQKLDRLNSGSIQVKDIVANAAFVQQECPRLLQDYARIAKGGFVKYQDVRRLLLGLMDGAVSKEAAKKSKQEITEDEARFMFDQLKDSDDFITAKALVEHKALVMKNFPSLVNDFEKIDLDKDSKITWDDLKVFLGGTAEWLEHELENVVGLVELKEQVRSFYRSMMLDKARRLAGHDVRGFAKAPHMIFQGSPGTGKTSLGRIMATLLHRIGVTSSPSLREVQRPDLVAEHVGQTAPKTVSVINEAKDGVLFIDEAYRLSGVESKNDFGREAIESLMAAMNDPPGKAPVMVFAGYVNDMSSFMRANEGLYRRIGYTFEFTDYSPCDLARILELVAMGKGFRIDSSLLADDREQLARVIEEFTLPRSRALMNGGLCERIFDLAKQNLDARDDPENPSVLLSYNDIMTACTAIPPPPALQSEAPLVANPVIEKPAVAMVPAAAPKQLDMRTESAVKEHSNVWFFVDCAEDLRRLGCCSGGSHTVSVRLGGREVHCSAPQAKGWRETRIVPYRGESLLEFVVLQGPKCVGAAVLALVGLDVFDGPLELRAMDRPAGKLYVKVGWQVVVGAPGADLLMECFAAETSGWTHP